VEREIHLMRRIPKLAAMVLLTATLAVAETEETVVEETPLSPPSTLSKVLRAFGIQSPPGTLGDKAYHRGDYEEALRQYGKAAEETVPSAPGTPLLDRNIGNALYRQKRFAEAKDYYESALKGASSAAGTDSGAASKAHHNLGNTFYRKAQAADSTELQASIADMREAVAHYKKALRYDRGNRPSKQNLEMANTALQKLLAREKKQQEQQQKQQQKKPEKPPEPSARAQEALARALQLTQERRYAEAATVLDEILRTDRTAAPFAAHRKRLDDVMKILRGETPSDPGPRDPRATPWSPGKPGGRMAP
jgi:tetratricopeptide (TPR) repeat protein